LPISLARTRARGIAFVRRPLIFPALPSLKTFFTGARGPVRNRVGGNLCFIPILQEMRHRKGGNLSGGQQQQLAIAAR